MIERYFAVDSGAAMNLCPPPPRFEPVPDPRPGFFWVQGHWDWQRERHVWVNGHWELERHGYRWLPHRWVERRGRWYLQEGGWGRLSELEALNLPNARRGAENLSPMAVR